MSVTTAPAAPLVLTDELLRGIEQRADRCDRAGQFFREDFEELREAGYYRAPVPAQYGGPGLTLREVAVLQRRLGYRSAPAALASVMHLSWAGAAADRARAADTSAERLLRAAADGEIIGTGRSGLDKDLVLWNVAATAVPNSGGQGRTLRTSFPPARTGLGAHGATPHGASSPTDRVIAALNGPEPASDPFLDSAAAWSVVLSANAYLGAAQRAFDLAVEISAGRTGKGLDGRPRTEDPLTQAGLAESVADLDAVEAHLDSAAREWTEKPVADAAWNRRLLSVKQHTTRTARAVVARSLEMTGDRPPRLGLVIERLYRDVAAGALHKPGHDTTVRALGSPDLTRRENFTR